MILKLPDKQQGLDKSRVAEIEQGLVRLLHYRYMFRTLLQLAEFRQGMVDAGIQPVRHADDSLAQCNALLLVAMAPDSRLERLQQLQKAQNAIGLVEALVPPYTGQYSTVGDYPRAEGVHQVRHEEVVWPRSNQRLLEDAVCQVIYVAAHTPRQHALDTDSPGNV